MVWTQTNRHLQLSSDNLDINNSLISDAHLCESLLGSTLPASVWQIAELMPNIRHYPSPFHHDQREQSYQERQMALYCGYRYQLTLIHEDAHLAIEDWIGQGITLTWGTQTQQIQTRHSLITEAVSLGSNQGMAAYRVTCEPALSQLRLSSHNRRYHHLSLSELIQDIFAAYNFDYQLDDALNDIHIQHSLQYNQTDLAYLSEQLSLYGITGYYRHSEDNHTLILLPHDNQTLHPDNSDISSILTQNPASLADTQDRITVLTPNTAHYITQTDLYRYDNRLTDHYTGSHQSEHKHKHTTAHSRFIHSHTRLNDDGLNKLAIRIQQWHTQQANSGILEGNIRHLSVPSHHHISGNPYQSAPISISAIHHHINNHLPINWLGSTPFDPISLQPNLEQLNQEEKDSASDQVHHITALYQPYPHNHHIPYGEMLNQIGQPHPSLTGLMSASIIADDTQSISNDRNHRAHIRYHWQTDDSTNSTNDDAAQWIPIASHLVADHMGQTHPLRHGQQVLVDFIGGDITQPIIIGSAHNGQGNDNAQHNRIASDTDYIDATSPTWFINPSHTYPIDGIKTQSIDTSRTGEANKDSDINGYNQLMFDQHPSHPQSQLYTSAYQSSLTLGSLHQHTDHERGSARGQGISLETKAAGNLQGANGVHITSYSADTPSHMSHRSHSRLQTADQQQQAYNQLAEQHQPVGLGMSPETSKEDAQTPFATFSEDTNSKALELGQWQQPHLLIDSQRHLALLTGQHSQHTSTKSSHSHATDNTYYHSQTQLNQLVAGDIHYYSNKAQTHTAAHGDLTLQAHTDQMRLDSEQILRIHSRDNIEIIAPDTLSLKAAGSGIEMSGGNVTLITPNQAGYKASKVDWGSGGGSMNSLMLMQDKLQKEDFKMNFGPETIDESLKPEEECPCKNGEVVETTTGAPVNVIQGSKVLFGNDDLDYAGKGYLPFVLKRMYNSQNSNIGWFGQGWTIQGYEQKLELDNDNDRIYLIDNTGRKLAFDLPKPGKSVIQPYASLTLYRLPKSSHSNSTNIKNNKQLYDFILYQGVHYPNSADYNQFEGASMRFAHTYNCNETLKVLPTQLSDRYGHRIQLNYTNSDNTTSYLPTYITDSSNNRYELKFKTFNNQPRLIQLNQVNTDQPIIELARYSYSDDGDLIKVYRHNHIIRQFAYTDHIMTWQEMPSGLQATYYYDQTHNAKLSRVVRHTINNGLEYQFEYGSTVDKNGNKYMRTVLIEQPNTAHSRKSEYIYDDSFVLKQYTDPLGHQTRMTHDHLDRLIKIENSNGGIIEYEFEGNQLKSKRVLIEKGLETNKAEYRTVDYKYVGNLLIALKDALGNTRKFTYDDKGQLIKTTDPLNNSTEFSYDEHGNLIQQTLANGSQFYFKFDKYGNLVSQIDCSGYKTSYQYDHKQRLKHIIDAEGSTTSYHYDDNRPWLDSLITRIDSPNGNSIVMQYNDMGKLINKYDDATNRSTSTHYAIDGLITQQTDALGHSIKFEYDNYRRLSQLVNENNENWTFEYDKGDRLVREIRFDNHQSQYRYDALNNLIHQVDNPHLPANKQRHVHYERDFVGQIKVQESKDADQSLRTAYQFDRSGKLISASNQNGIIEFDYDNNGQLIAETQINTHDGINRSKPLVLKHQYDEIGNRIATELPDGKVIKQMHYGSGHLYNQSLFNPLTEENIELRHSERNKLHIETFRQQGNLQSVFKVDPMGILRSQQSSRDDNIVISRQYHYDPLGQLTDIKGQTDLTGISDNIEHFTRNHNYQYDAVGRLTEHKLSSQNRSIIEQFAFDATGNRLSTNNKGIVIKDNANQYISKGRPTELVSNGKLISYKYDEHGRVVYKLITANPHQTDTSLVQYKKELSFSYNPNNELIRTELKAQKGSDTITTTTQYYYDAFGRRIHKISDISYKNATENKSTHILWDGDKPIQEYNDTHVFTTIYDQGSFAPVARAIWSKDDNQHMQIYYYHNDQLGTPNELTNDKGEVVWLADYEAWGRIAKEKYETQRYETQRIGNFAISAEELQPIRFQGQSFDVETELHYNRFRYYDPDMGMFISRDPIGLMGGDNVFAYAPNPTGWIDPLGLKGIIRRGSITSPEAMNQARVMRGDGPLCNILGIGCNDDHLVCTNATFTRDDGSKSEIDYIEEAQQKQQIIPTGVLWPPTPSRIKSQGAECNEVSLRKDHEYKIR